MGTPDLLGTYGTFSFFTSRAVRVRRPGRCRAAWCMPVDVARRRRAARARRARQPVPRDAARRCSAEFTALHRSRAAGTRSSSSATRSGCCGSASGATGCRSSFQLAPTQSLHGEVPVLPEAARPVSSSSTSARSTSIRSTPALPISTPGDYAAELARATGRFYTQGMPEDTKGAEDRRAHAPTSSSRRRASPATRTCGSTATCSTVRRRPALLLLRQRRPGVAHDVAGAGSRASRLRRAADAPYRARRRGALRRARRGRRRHARAAGAGRPAGRDVGPRLHVVAARVSPEQLAARQRLSDACSIRTARDDPGFFGNVDWSRTRAYGARPERPLPQRRRAARATASSTRQRARGAGRRDRRASC